MSRGVRMRMSLSVHSAPAAGSGCCFGFQPVWSGRGYLRAAVPGKTGLVTDSNSCDTLFSWMSEGDG